MKKKLLLALSLLMVFGILPISVFAAFAAESPLSLDLTNGSIVITETGYTQGDAIGETEYVGAYIITQTNAETETSNTVSASGTQNITLNGVNINAVNAAAISVTGMTNLTLLGNNKLTSAENFAGVEVNSGAALIITADSIGSLNAIGGRLGAGIGGGNNKQAGDITINAGTIIATAGTSGAGIGGGCYGDGGTTIINGGIITTTCNGNNGAGIGGGFYGASGKITINDGIINATGGKSGTGIGSGNYAIRPNEGDMITINGGTVYAYGKSDSAGIGGANCTTGTDVTITGGTVYAYGGRSGAGIGGGWSAGGGTTTISGGTVYAYGGDGLGTAGGGGAGIGSGGVSADNTAYNGGVITITGGTVYAEGGSGVDADGNPVSGSSGTAGGGAAGIGGACRGVSGVITITGGTVNAVGGDASGDMGGGAGIGAGAAQGFGTGYYNSNTQTYVFEPVDITIIGANVTAIGGKGIEGTENTVGVAIGGSGENVEGCNVTVSCGTYSDISTNYISNGCSVIKYTATNEDIEYYVVGKDSIGAAVENAKDGDSIDVIQGTLTLDIPKDNITVTNSGNGNITINGIDVVQGGFIVTTPCQIAHLFGAPTYEWSFDNRTCTAKRVCAHNSAHIDTENALVKRKITQAASCTKNELTTFTATFTNSAFTTQIEENVKTADRRGHTYGDLIERVDATCSTAGFETHYLCNACGTYFTSEKTAISEEKLVIAIDENAHLFNTPVYEWSSDSSICNAIRVCTHNASHIETENGIVQKETTQIKSCTADELATYTATFTAPVFTTQIKENVKTADKLGHSYGNFNARVNATCSSTGFEAYYFCDTCDTYFTSEKAETSKEKLTIAINENAHAYSASAYDWSYDNSTCTAVRVCGYNGAHTEKEIVVPSKMITQNQSCITDEVATYTANFTNPAFATQIKENLKSADKLGHTYDNECDADCNICKENREVGEHVFNKNGICEYCGFENIDKNNTAIAVVSIISCVVVLGVIGCMLYLFYYRKKHKA